MSSDRHYFVSPFTFVEALEAAGLVHNRDRISEVVIRANPKNVVTIEVTYIADERVFGLTKPRETP